MERRTIQFTGNVQGVGFRYGVDRAADGRAVTGHVRNLSDGRVELIVEGEAGEIDALLADVRDRFVGHITDESTQTAAATGEFADFAIGH